MNQADIIFKLKNGDTAAFQKVVLAWQDKVYNTSLSIVQHAQDAEDITQEVFVTLYERIADFREEATLATWMYRITVSKSLDHEKRKRRSKYGGLVRRIFFITQEDEPLNFDHPGILLDNKEKAAVLFKALKKLPEKQRIVFTLHKTEGLSYHEIARVMNTSLYAIESLQTRAKNNLKEILKSYYQQHL
ncbi:MAG: RNA polymerase sigma factor [Ferruginibacter sp.]|nr:RNA polymerase sigma factor [Ferruginibacter sp.]